jgi:hypothetical protein
MSENLVVHDAAQPLAERASPLALESGQLAMNHQEDLLSQILDVINQTRIALGPGKEQRPVEIVEPPPGFLIRTLAQAIEQTGGGFHGRSSAGSARRSDSPDEPEHTKRSHRRDRKVMHRQCSRVGLE